MPFKLSTTEEFCVHKGILVCCKLKFNWKAYKMSMNSINTPYTPAQGVGLNRNEIIQRYFHLGYTNKEICSALRYTHNHRIGLTKLKSVLRQLGLCRRFSHDDESSLEDISNAISMELEGSGQCLGYRAMWRRLKQNTDLRVKRHTVMELMRILDPEGVENRKKRRIRRRQYVSAGPNFIWHIDGYDKLKPYGLCIHGAIDGYSRRILWLEVSSTNNNPNVIATYYLKCLQSLKIAPRVLRSDCGTENSIVEILQKYFRSQHDDDMAGDKSFLYGTSTSNQRIESWWSIFKRINCQWWISLFKDLRDAGVFQGAHEIHIECMRYCFMKVLQNELDAVREEWNVHHISPRKNNELSNVRGKPDVLYFLPHTSEAEDYGFHINLRDVEACLEIYGTQKPRLGCTELFSELVHLILPERNEQPASVEEALIVYNELMEGISLYES